jgi:hypothetical protein
VSAVVIGGAEAVIMAGGLVGAIAAPRIRAHVTVRQALVVFTVTGTLAMLAAAAIMPSPAIAVPLAIALVLSPAMNAVLFAIMLPARAAGHARPRQQRHPAGGHCSRRARSLRQRARGRKCLGRLGDGPLCRVHRDRPAAGAPPAEHARRGSEAA